jgi:AcrR family transcriptional regulator
MKQPRRAAKSRIGPKDGAVSEPHAVTTPDKPGKERAIENRRRIQAAALTLFTTQGFHGTNNREIAERAGVSASAIYLHYSSKEAIFIDLVQKYRTRMTELFESAFDGLNEPLSKHDLEALASVIWTWSRDKREYMLLVLIDVIEFKNQHFAEFFHDMPVRLRRLLGSSLSAVAEQPGWRGHDPAFVLAAVCNYFFHCVLMENYMRADRHLGVENAEAIRGFVELLSNGLMPSPAKRPRPPAAARCRPVDQAAPDRIEFMRLLCGRLWNPPPEILSRLSGKKADKTSAKRSILFMPAIAPDRPDETQLRIEAAALEMFTTHGFHGTSIRDIADAAGLSQGTIYTYYDKKETMFDSLASSYQACMSRFTRRVFLALDEPFAKNDLRLLAWAVRSMVYDEAQYVLLMFIDVVEFKSQHFADQYRDIPAQLRHLLGPALDKAEARPDWCGLDPAFVLATIYLFFFNYFVIEGLMRGDQHLGAPDDEAIEHLIDLLTDGLWAQTGIDRL